MSLENFGKYQLIKKLATGGMAQIYLARQTGLEGFEKLLVVKRILPHLAENEDFIKMFLDEARIAARLNHPNIVQIFDLGAQDDSFFIAMEYIHGEDVRRVWKRAEAQGRDLPIALICRIIMEACAGLDYAHKKTDQSGNPLGIVHRDISPQNILVTFEGGVKVVDFGIAKAADQATVTRSGVLKGKYSYMSPEQASGKKVDARTDIFALGVVLYELLTGTRLFKRANDIQTLNAVTECQVTPPSEVKAGLPKDLDGIVLKALAKKPDDRYPDAAALQAALEHWLIENKLPSSSAPAAAFLHDIYRERLAKEAEEGRILVEELKEAGRVTDEANLKATGSARSSKSLRPVPSKATPGPREKKDDQDGETRAQRPARTTSIPKPLPKAEKSLDKQLDERSQASKQQARTDVSSTEAEKRSKLPLVAAIVALAAVGIAVVAFALSGSPGGTVVITSDPPDARVVIDGQTLGHTPFPLRDKSPGRYPLVLELDGYEDARHELNVPKSGETTERFRLTKLAVKQAPEPEVVPEPRTEVEPKEEIAPAPATTLVSIRSVPAGAVITVAGTRKGVTPMKLELPEKGLVAIELSHSGYRDLSVDLDASKGAEQSFTLEKEKRGTTVVRKEREPAIETAPPPSRQFGMVRFVVKPWAAVSCGGVKLGETPFPPVQLPAGTHECTFANPDLGQKRETVKVVANETTKVAVSF